MNSFSQQGQQLPTKPRFPRYLHIQGVPRFVFQTIRRIITSLPSLVGRLGTLFKISKQKVVSRMFWGRGNLYRSSFHILIGIITVAFLVTGLLNKFGASRVEATPLAVSDGAQTNYDLLAQGGNLSTVLPLDPGQINFTVYSYKVKASDSLDSLATKFKVSKDTIRWANGDLISPYNDDLTVGWVLQIPEINGVLYAVKADDDLQKVLELTKGNRTDVIEINGLKAPKYSLKGIDKLFIPNGELPPPPPRFISRSANGSGGFNPPAFISPPLNGLPRGFFDDPLSSTTCAGYIVTDTFGTYHPWVRNGFHDGVDLAKGGGCYIRAAGNGKVIFAGIRDFGSGYTVIIDHGNGVQTYYEHGDGNIWVQVGDNTYKGQVIMYMGRSGNATGVHLHIGLKVNGAYTDPSPYIPYHR